MICSQTNKINIEETDISVVKIVLTKEIVGFSLDYVWFVVMLVVVILQRTNIPSSIIIEVNTL